MAYTQPLRGDSSKIYNIINNFDKGIDKKTADDVSLDSSFKELKNFYNESEGYLSKRPGIYNSNITDFIDAIVTENYDKEKVSIEPNKFKESKEDILKRLEEFNSVLLGGIEKSKEYDNFEFVFFSDKLIGFQVLKNNFFLDFMQSYKQILQGEDITLNSNFAEFACIVISSGFYTKKIDDKIVENNKPGLYISRLYISILQENNKYKITFEIDSVDSTMNPFKHINASNLLDYDNMTGVYIDAEGHEQKGDTNSCTPYILLEANQQYTIASKTNFYNIGVALFDESKKFISRKVNNNVNKVTIDAEDKNRYIRIWFVNESGGATTKEHLKEKEAQFVEGSEALPYMDYSCRWSYIPEKYIPNADDLTSSNTIDISNYNGFSYIATGSNYIIKIDQDPEEKKLNETYPDESNVIVQIGGYNGDNLYKPTAIELSQIGFNILANDPLTYIDKSGAIKKVKGVFYSVNITKDGITFKQPVTKVPYNSEFYVHVLYTGDTAPTSIQYRPDNGEVDAEKNPYKALPGAWEDSEKTIWKCTGIDSDQRFEVLIKLDVDEFRTYINTSSAPLNETGYIKDISELVFSSTHSKIINNQLVLYGGHGYVFFSEYDVFNYFPNYYFIYVASEAGEEEVTEITYFRQYYAVFTNKRIKRMSGTFGSDDFGIYPLSDFIGCPNGRTVHPVGNNLLFLGNDGVYKLKQGYLGEGTENIEKIDDVLGGELNLNNVLQAFVMNNNYVIVKNDGSTWIVYNTITEAFYEYNVESKDGIVYQGSLPYEDFSEKVLPFYSVFQASLYDEHGDFVIVPMYSYSYNEDLTEAHSSGVNFMIFRFDELNFLDKDLRHKDGEGFISTLETHFMNMGYPTHTKKFKDLYIKMINESGHIIPLFITIMIDDKTVISPSNYKIVYNEDTDTYYYVENIENNSEIYTTQALGEFTLAKDILGNKTIQQIRLRIREKGRAIKIILSDGYDDYTEILSEGTTMRGFPIRYRNINNFSLSTMGIVYKLKKVKEG